MRALLLLPVATFLACGTEDDPPPEPPTGPTWYAEVGPMVAEHCMGCHQPGGIAPFSLATYDDAAEVAPRMLEAVETGIMPPFDARESDACRPRHGWKDDPRLSAEQIATLRAWVTGGTLAGVPTPITLPPVPTLSGVSRTLTPTQPFVTAGDDDQFICFALDPQNPRLEWVSGMQVRPGNPDVVHHAVTVAAFPKRAAADPDGWNEELRASGMIGVPFDCGGAGVTSRDNTFLLGVWTPGNQPIDLPAGVAAPLLARSLVVVQIHYHPGGRLENAPDATSIDLRYTGATPQYLYTAVGVGNAFAAPQLLAGPDDRGAPEFRIPANRADHRERMRFTLEQVDQPVSLLAAYPHMHYIGSGIDVAITRAAPAFNQPTNECLYNGGWNFDWQRSYLYDATLADLPTLDTGDVIELGCSYDNTLDNPFVRRALADANLSAPIDVVLGEQTLDEMCLGIFGVVVPFAPAARAPDAAMVWTVLDRARPSWR